MRFVQITDTHLVPRGQFLHGLDPLQRLEDCIADINQHSNNLRFCVITGDLTDRGDIESYGLLREILQGLKIQYHLMLGNHDRRETFLKSFPEAPQDDNGFVQFKIDTTEGVLVFLDTLDEGKSSGIYCEPRCRWLADRLTEAGDQPVYLFMHHPPFDIGFPSLDRMKLDHADSFAAVLETNSNIRHLFFGHVHRALSGSWRNIPFSALPGTNHQIATDFKSVTPMPYSHGPAAYAFVHLDHDFNLIHLHNYLDDNPCRISDKS